MSEKMINDRVVTIISTVTNLPTEKIKDTTTLDELSSDSIKMFELLIAFEEVLGKSISYEDVSSVETVRDIKNLAFKFGLGTAVAGI